MHLQKIDCPSGHFGMSRAVAYELPINVNLSYILSQRKQDSFKFEHRVKIMRADIWNWKKTCYQSFSNGELLISSPKFIATEFYILEKLMIPLNNGERAGDQIFINCLEMI